MPALANGLFSSNSAPSATKLVRANSQSCAAMVFGSVDGVIARAGIRTRPLREPRRGRCCPYSCLGVLASLGTGSSRDRKVLRNRPFFGIKGQLNRQQLRRDESARYTQEREVRWGSLLPDAQRPIRSEERRVGKEWRSRG